MKPQEAQGNAEMVYAIVFPRHEIPAFISRKKEILGVFWIQDSTVLYLVINTNIA